jgi:alcohol dehydrogenase
MNAVHIDAGRVSIRPSFLLPRPKGHALIRLIVAGICNTDLELQRGYYAFTGTPGHEFAGEVIEADTASLIGKRVVGEINLACGACDWCHRGLGRHCPTRTVLGIVKHPGAFSEYLTLPESNLLLVPDSLPSDVAVFTEPVAAACEILEQVAIPKGEPVAVLGDGKLGLLIAQVLKIHGCEVHLYGHHPERAKIAGVSIGEPARFNWIVEATGSAAGLKSAIAMVNPRGAVIMKSTVHGNVEIDTAAVIVNEITLLGSRCGRFEPALKLLESGVLNVTQMIHARYPLTQAEEAFKHAATKGVLKVLLDNQ